MANKVQILFEAVGADKVSSSFKEASSGATGLSTSLDKLAIQAGIGVASFTALAAASVASAAVYRAFSSEISGLASTLRKAEVEFAALTGSVEEAHTRVEALYRFAQSTPFETKSIIDAARGLEAIGLKAGDAETALRLIGDAAAGTGTEVEKVATAYGRVVAAFESGQGIAQAVNTFRDLGVLTAAEATEIVRLAQSAETAQQAFDLLNRKMQEFGGSMEQQMNTIPALMTRLMDSIDRLTGGAFEPLIAITKEALRALIAFASDDSTTAWSQRVGANIQLVIDKFITFVLDIERGVRSVAVPIAFLGSIFEDLGNAQIPSFARATEAAGAAVAKLNTDMQGIGTRLRNFTDGTRENRDAVDQMVKSVDLYVAKMPQLGDVTRKAADSMKDAGEAAKTAAAEFAQAMKTFGDEVKRLESVNTIFANLQKSIDSLHMTAAEKELAGFREQLEKINGLSPSAVENILAIAKGMIQVRDETAIAKKELQDAAKYMQDLTAATTTATPPLSALGGALKDVSNESADAAVQVAILTDSIKVLVPANLSLNNTVVNTVESVVQFGDAMRDLKPTAASAAVALDILNDSVSEAGAASIKAEQSWEKFRVGLKDMALSVTGTFTKMADGLIAGTLDIGDAFKDLGQSLLTNFTQLVLHKVFDPILEKAADFVADFIDIIVGGISSFDWGGFFNSIFGGGGGGGGGFSGGDWWDDIDFDFYAHGGRVRRTGPAIVHEGETVVPAGYGTGWQSGGLTMPRSGGGSDVIPVRVENVDAFGQQFGSWAGKVISAAPLALQAAGWVTGSSALSGAGSGLGIMGALKTGYNMFTGAPNIPGAWAPGVSGMGPYDTGWSQANVSSLVSGVGSILGIVGGLTGNEALGYAGLGIQGAVLVTQIVSSLVPSVSSAITGAGTAIASSIGGSVGAYAGSAVGNLAGIGASAGVGAGAAAVHYLISSLAERGTEEISRQTRVRQQSGRDWTSEAYGRAGDVRTLADLDIKSPSNVFGEFTPRQDLQMLAAWASKAAEQASLSITSMTEMAKAGDSGGVIQDLINLEETSRAYFQAFIAKAAQVGVTPEQGMDLINVSPQGVTKGHGLQGGGQGLMDFWTLIIDRLIGGLAPLDAAATETTSSVTKTVSSIGAFEARVGGFMDALEASGIGMAGGTAAIARPRFFGGTVTGGEDRSAVPGIPETGAVEWGGVIFDLTNKTGEELATMLTTFEEQVVRLIGFDDMTEGLNRMAVALDLTIAATDVFVDGTKTMFKDIFGNIIDISWATADELKTIVDTQIATMADEIAKDPIKLLPLLDMSKFQREGEKIEETAERVALSLMALGMLMENLDVEILGLTNPLGAATLAFTNGLTHFQTGMETASETFEESALRFDASSGLIGDPTAMVEAAVAMHDLLIGRYEAELALIAAITAAVGNLYTAGIAITQMGPFLQSIGVSIGPVVEGLTAFAGTLTQAGPSLTAFGGAVQAFGNLAMLAGQTADPALIQSAVTSWGNLMSWVPTIMSQIMDIQDPTERMQAVVTFMGQLGTAAQAAVAGILALIETVNTLAGQSAQAGNTLASNGALFAEAGINLAAAATDMLTLSTMLPTIGAIMTTLNSGVNLFIAAVEAGQDIDPQTVITAITSAFTAAMAITDPGERSIALAGVMTTITTLLGGLPEGMATTIKAALLPLITLIGEALIAAGGETGTKAVDAGEVLIGIVGPGGALNPATFTKTLVDGITLGMQGFLKDVPDAFQFLVDAFTGAGTDIQTAIKNAGDVLTTALGTFKTAAEQLTSGLTGLDVRIGDAVKNGVIDAITATIGGSAQSGLGYVPETGLYMLHQGEGVLTAEENAALNSGVLGSYQGGTGRPFIKGDPRPGYGTDPAVIDILVRSNERYAASARAAAAATGGLTDAVDAYRNSINQAGRSIAQFSDAIPTAELRRLADVFARWSQALGDVTQKAAAFTTGIQLWARVVERTDDVMGELVSGGRGVLDTIQSMVKAATAMTDADPGAKLDALVETYNAVAGAAESMQNAVRASFNRQREALQESLDALDDQQNAIQEQISSLEELRQATEEWANVAESVADMLLELRLSDLAPPDAMAQFQLAKSEFQSALEAFRLAPTAEGARGVQERARDVLGAATEVFTRPSPEYQALFTSITGALEEVQGIAEERGQSQEGLLQQIADLEARSEQLDIQRNALEEQTRVAIEQLNAQEQAALAAIQATVGPELQALAAEMERVAILAAQQDMSLSRIATGVDRISDQIGAGGGAGGGVAGAGEWVGPIPELPPPPEWTTEPAPAPEWVPYPEDQPGFEPVPAEPPPWVPYPEDQPGFGGTPAPPPEWGPYPEDQPRFVPYPEDQPGFGGTPAEPFPAVPYPEDPWEGTPAAQQGAWRTRAGVYTLHPDEMVLPASVASAVRAGASGAVAPGGGAGGGVTFNFDNVTVTGTREGAREFFKELEVLTERSMRFGTLNRVLKHESKGA